MTTRRAKNPHERFPWLYVLFLVVVSVSIGVATAAILGYPLWQDDLPTFVPTTVTTVVGAQTSAAPTTPTTVVP